MLTQIIRFGSEMKFSNKTCPEYTEKDLFGCHHSTCVAITLMEENISLNDPESAKAVAHVLSQLLNNDPDIPINNSGNTLIQELY